MEKGNEMKKNQCRSRNHFTPYKSSVRKVQRTTLHSFYSQIMKKTTSNSLLIIIIYCWHGMPNSDISHSTFILVLLVVFLFWVLVYYYYYYYYFIIFWKWKFCTYIKNIYYVYLSSLFEKKKWLSDLLYIVISRLITINHSTSTRKIYNNNNIIIFSSSS